MDESAPPVLDDWRLAVATGVNILLQGDEHSTRRTLRCARLRSPVQILSAGSPLMLGARGIATVVLHHVEGLDADQQRRLLRWMERGDRPQIVSVSSVSLHTLVEGERFLEPLYYRLNTVLIDARRVAGV